MKSLLQNLKISLYLIAILLPMHAWALDTPWQSGKGGSSEARILLNRDSVNATNDKVQGLIEFKLKKGWHVYWKNPGEIGLPPRLLWKTESSWKANPLQFQRPQRIESKSDLVSDSFGYTSQAFYPFSLEGNGKLSGQMRLDYLVCEVQCIPERLTFNITLPEGTGHPSKDASFIESKINSLPKTWGQASPLVLQVLKEKTFLIKSNRALKDIFVAATTSELERIKLKKLSATEWQIELPREMTELEFTLDAESGPATLIQQLTQSSEKSQNDISLWWALLFALLGGFILNLMPCVLPVLLLKTNSLLKWKNETKEARRSFLSTALGILSSFLVLSLITLSLQKLGHKIGWGFQFQNSIFVLCMIFIIYLFALSIFEIFNFNIGSKTSTKISNVRGSFFEGVFATLLATPCSAPFLGTALTYALQKPPLILILFYLVMGIGLATPYFLMFALPNTLKLLPRPGPWMDRLKNILGYSLLATCLWLIYVLHQQIGSAPVFILLFVLLLILLVLTEIKNIFRWALVFLVILATVLGLNPSDKSKPHTAFSSYSESLISEKIQGGKVLFVVVTADWCLTCKYNEKLVIETEWFQKFLKEKNAELIIFDWTQRNDDIGSFLNSFNRVAIPFSAWIGDKKKLALPEILTRSVIEKAWNDFQNN